MAAADPDLAAADAQLQNLLADGTAVRDFLDQLAALAASIVPNSACGITVRRGAEAATVANSGEFAAQVDELQYGAGEGPCLEAMDTDRTVGMPEGGEPLARLPRPRARLRSAQLAIDSCNRRLADVAANLIEPTTGYSPQPPRPFADSC